MQCASNSVFTKALAKKGFADVWMLHQT